MAYEGEGKGGKQISFRGTSKVSIDNALRAAVHASGAKPRTTFVVTHIEVTTKGDPNVGTYSVVISRGGGR